jgi:type II secretory pathway component PulK
MTVRRSPKQVSGVALILVLMITGVLGILMLQIGLTTKQNVSDTQRLQDRAEAWLNLHSRERGLEFTLLTNEWLAAEEAMPGTIPASWNFRGQSFPHDSAVYQLQDISGLVPMPLPGQPTEPIRDVLVQLGIDAQRSESIMQQYRSVVSGAGNSSPALIDSRQARNPLQAFGELLNLTDITTDELRLLESIATLYPSQSFNPLTAPPEVLAARLPGLGGQSAVELQREGRLTRENLFDLTGLGIDDFTSFYPGPAFRTEITVSYKGIRQTRRSTVIVQPYSNDPIVLWSRQRLREPGARP